MFNSKITSLDRPVLIKGKALKFKLQKRINVISEKIVLLNNTLVTKYERCLEGTLASEQKRELQKTINDYELQIIWLNNLLKIIKNKITYTLTLSEAITLEIIEK